MTLTELKNKVTVQTGGIYGHYHVTIDYRGTKYLSVTTNSLACDRIKASKWHIDEQRLAGYTLKQAYQALWDECKRDFELR